VCDFGWYVNFFPRRPLAGTDELQDDGKTWGNRQLVYRAKNGVAAAPQIANCRGVLIVTFQTDEDGKGTCMKAVVGRPGQWENKTLLGPCESTWGGIMTLDGSSALVMFDNGGCKCRKVVLKREASKEGESEAERGISD